MKHAQWYVYSSTVTTSSSSAGSTLRFLSHQIAKGSKLNQSGQHRRCLQLRYSCCLNFIPVLAILVNNLILQVSLSHLCLPAQHTYICSWTCYLFSLQWLLFSEFIQFVIPHLFCNADVVCARLRLHFHSIFYTRLRNSRHITNSSAYMLPHRAHSRFPSSVLYSKINNKMLVTFSNLPSLFVAFPLERKRKFWNKLTFPIRTSCILFYFVQKL